jgi:hypothetical protein
LSVLGVGPAESLRCEPLDDLVVGDHQGPGSVGHGNHVTDVVTVPVAEDDHIGGHLVGRHRRVGVAGQERVDQDVRPVGLDQERPVTQEGHRGRHRLLSPVGFGRHAC